MNHLRVAAARRVSARPAARAARAVQCHASMKALIFDCDGVILESEDLHRRAYNATFKHFKVKCGEAAAYGHSRLLRRRLALGLLGDGPDGMAWTVDCKPALQRRASRRA